MLDIEETTITVAARDRERIRTSALRLDEASECPELLAQPATPTPPQPVCAECIAEGLSWVALRRCLDCGNIGCCDSSPGRHATAHFHATQHPVMQSAQPDEVWRWCYVHHLTA